MQVRALEKTPGRGWSRCRIRAPSRKVRAYRARRDRQKALAAARSRLKGVAVDGKTSRGARRKDGSRGHLLGVAEHASSGGRFLDQVEVDVKQNEISHFRAVLEDLDLAGTVLTFDALLTVRTDLDWLVKTKHAHYIAVVKKNQPLLYRRLKDLPWKQIPTGDTTREIGHGRIDTRTVKAAISSPTSPARTSPPPIWPGLPESNGRLKRTTTPVLQGSSACCLMLH